MDYPIHGSRTYSEELPWIIGSVASIYSWGNLGVENLLEFLKDIIIREAVKGRTPFLNFAHQNYPKKRIFMTRLQSRQMK